MKRKRFTRTVLALSAAAAAVIAARSLFMGGVRAESAADVSDFLTDCGIRAVYLSEKEVTIPASFSEVYENYNELQKQQGFDLSKHKGQSAVAYTFTVLGRTDENGEPVSDVEAHVLVCEGEIIGGDIASTRLDGFMEPLR